MEARPVPTERAATPDRAYAWALLAIALALLSFRLGAKDVWEASEGRPLESAREMRAHGDWLVQYTNGAVDLTKPPLYAWCVGALFHVTGVENEFVGRIPSVLASLGVLGAVYVLGRRIAGPRAGFLAGFALLTTAKFLWQARLAELETLLALGVMWSYVSFDTALEAKTPRARWGAFAAYHAAVGFAFAVKGPISLLLVVPGVLTYALATGRGRRLLFWAYPATGLVTLVVGCAWYFAVVLRDPTSLGTFLSYARGENVGHLRSPLYYFLQYPLYALPWTPLALIGLGLRWARDLPPDAALRARLPVAAFAVTFLVQSALHAKQTHYLVPVVFPMGALLAGLVLDRWLARRESRTAARGVGIAFALLLALEAVGVAWIVPSRNASESSRAFMSRVAARVPAGQPLGWTIFGSHSDYLWYLPMSLVGTTGIPELVGATPTETIERVRAHLAGGGPRWAIVYSDEAAAIGRAAVVVERDDAFQKKARKVVLLHAGGPR